MKVNKFHIIIGKFLLIFLCFLIGCDEALLHNLTEIQVNRLIGILNNEGIEASKELQSDTKWTLNVKKQDLVSAISILDSKRLLKDNTAAIKESSSLLGSNQEKNFFYERVLSAELEKTLLTLTGVFDARVHLNIKKSDTLSLRNDEEQNTSASVLMVVSEDEIFDISKIKSIISGASGIKSDDVSVVISRININKKNESKSTQDMVNILSNDNDLSKNMLINNGNMVQVILTFFKDKIYYLYGVLILLAIIIGVKAIKRYKNNKKLDLIKTISIISK